MSGRLRWEVEGRDWPLREASAFVEAAGLRWHVQTLGDGPVVVLLHGTGASTHSWRDVAPLLADRHRVVSVDLPGHGFTTGRPHGVLTLMGMARALAQLFAQLGHRPALVAGHSAGAAIAVQLALDGATDAPIVGFAPALLPFAGVAGPIFSGLAGLVFANPLSAHLIAGIARDPQRVARFLARSTGSAIDPAGVALYRRLFASPDHCRGAMAMMAGWNLNALARDLPRLPVPLHVVHGSRDTAIPTSNARSATAKARDGRFELISGLGHLLHEERPELAAAMIAHLLPTAPAGHIEEAQP